jgi:hypothetical protein
MIEHRCAHAHTGGEPASSRLVVTFAYHGITYVRICPSRVYYDTLLHFTRRHFDDVHGSLDPPASPCPACPSKRLFARLSALDHQGEE